MTRPQRQPARAEVRAQLEDAAARLFATRGYAATTVEEIVDAAGVSKPALYRHFESKKDLHLALLRRHRAELADAALGELSPGTDPVDRLPAMIDAWFLHVEEHPYTWRMLFRDTTGDPDIAEFHTEMSRIQRDADVTLLRTHAPGLPEAELEPLGEIIRSSLTGLALWWLDHPDTRRATLVDAMTRTVRGMLATA